MVQLTTSPLLDMVSPRWSPPVKKFEARHASEREKTGRCLPCLDHKRPSLHGAWDSNTAGNNQNAGSRSLPSLGLSVFSRPGAVDGKTKRTRPDSAKLSASPKSPLTAKPTCTKVRSLMVAHTSRDLGECGKSLVVNVSDAGRNRTVISVVARDEGWQLDSTIDAEADVYVVSTEKEVHRRARCLQPSQRMSQIPGMRNLCNKIGFAKLMRRMQRLDPERFTFWPRSYILPPETVALSQHMLDEDSDIVPSDAFHEPLIFKPANASCGHGISLLMKPWDLDKKRDAIKSNGAIVQEYISSPLLLQGLKWDLRVYVLVLSLQPLRALLCKEGLARLCCEPYMAPSMMNKANISCHLTNYSISKCCGSYSHTNDPADGSRGNKRTWSSTLAFLETLGHDVNLLRDQVREIAAATTEAMASEFSRAEVHVKRNCFHILGLDIIFNEEGRGWLLEVNCHPSFCIDSVFPAEGPFAEAPLEVSPDSPEAPVMMAARAAMGAKAKKLCRCLAHHWPHRHAPCAVDLAAKTACMSGTLEVVQRDLYAATCPPPCCAELAAGTGLEALIG
eukprot:TRINITY_DN5717_c0_g1_i2.p1 TRINITY_DN5717_c0_g1~~TRINITY_DN5717_c0_g1_i2.p1  ORF type:complete len:562 (+),score=60.82 TRINITY_DN5717_c0_g1_i2:94-1779(+)